MICAIPIYVMIYLDVACDDVGLLLAWSEVIVLHSGGKCVGKGISEYLIKSRILIEYVCTMVDW